MDQNQDNVINMGNKAGYPLFSPHLRKQIEYSVKPHSENPEDAVNAMESALCRWIVTKVRRGASKLGEAIGHKITNAADEAFNG